MSVESTNDDAETVKESEVTDIEQAADDVLEELDDRFHEHSELNIDNDNFILIPKECRRSKRGNLSNIIHGSKLRRIMKNHDFKFNFISRCQTGVGVEIWFEYDG